MGSETIRVEHSGSVMILALNRPDKLNSFNSEMSLALQQALADAKGDHVRVVVLTGTGKGFCAGQELGDDVLGKDGEKPDLSITIDKFWNPIVRSLRSLGKPVICAVNGVAAGAGANVALACDIVLAARSAKFIQPFNKLGLVPDSGGTYFLPRLVGEARALGLTLLGEPLSAEKAESWGLIWKVYDDDQLMNEAMKLAAHLATQPTFGLGLVKQAIYASSTNTLDEQLDLERDLQKSAGESADYTEGVKAFLERRPANFIGK